MQPFAFNPYLASHFTWFGAGIFLPLFITLMVLVIVLKGYALWYSARGNQKWWFIAMVVINTMGILEVVYLLFFKPKARTATKDENKKQKSVDGDLQTESK